MLRVYVGDITRFEGDAIVNAASPGLLGGGGVDGAIHRAAGPDLLRECYAIMRERNGIEVPIGSAIATAAGNLAVRYVIHTVGPVWHSGVCDEISQLRSCYQACMQIVHQLGLRSVAFPAISNGAYGVPIAYSAPIVFENLRDERDVDISLVFYSEYDANEFLGAADPQCRYLSGFMQL